MARKKSSPPVNRYSVIPGITHVAHGDQVYQVVDHVVELPARAGWYVDLVVTGMLTLLPVEVQKSEKPAQD